MWKKFGMAGRIFQVINDIDTLRMFGVPVRDHKTLSIGLLSKPTQAIICFLFPF